MTLQDGLQALRDISSPTNTVIVQPRSGKWSVSVQETWKNSPVFIWNLEASLEKAIEKTVVEYLTACQ